MVQECSGGWGTKGTCDNKSAGQMAIPYCVLVPIWIKKTLKMCGSGNGPWQRNGERLRQKCITGGLGGLVAYLPHVWLTSTLSLGAQALDASACGAKENSKPRDENRFLARFLTEDRDKGGAGG